MRQQRVKAATLHPSAQTFFTSVVPPAGRTARNGLLFTALTQKHCCVPTKENHKSLSKSAAGFGVNFVINSCCAQNLVGGQNCRAVKRDGCSFKSGHLSLGEARRALGNVPTVPKAFLLPCKERRRELPILFTPAEQQTSERSVLSLY